MTTQTAESLALKLEEEVRDYKWATPLEREAAAMLRSQAAEKASLVQQRDELLKKAVEQAQEIERLQADAIRYSYKEYAAIQQQQKAEIERLKGESLAWAKRSLEQDKEIKRLRIALRDCADELIRHGRSAYCGLEDISQAVIDAARAALEIQK